MTVGKVASCNWGLWIIVTIFCALGVIHSVVVPLFEAPDEIWHFSFVRVLATRRALPAQPTEGKNVWLREAGQPPLYYVVAAPFVAPLDTSDFPGFVRFNAAHPAVTPGIQNEVTNIFIHTPHEEFPYRGAVLAVHIVRLLSVLWGAGTVVGADLLAREVVPDRPGVALVTAAITAFNPHFVFISSVVNNDVCAACVCTFGLWLAVRLGRQRRFRRLGTVRNDGGLREPVALGLVLGLALLTKMSALALLPLVLLTLGLTWWWERNARASLVRGAVVFGLAGLVGAWWYVRNWLLYGDPLAWGVWMMDLPVVPIGPVELVRQFGHVATSYWSPYEGLFPQPVFWALGLLGVLAVVGWVRMIVRRDVRTTVNVDGLLLTGVWFLMLFASLIQYMITTPSDEGRLLFPGIAALSLLLGLGLEAVAPRRRTDIVMSVVGVGLLALSIASPFCAIVPRYALPLVNSVQDISTDSSFDDALFGSVRLLGVEISPDEAQPGETVSVTLYWQTQDTPPADLRAVVQLWTFGGRLVGQRDTTPAGAVHPPDLWRAGDIVRDVHRMQLNEDRPAVCHVAVRVMVGDELLGQVSSRVALKLTGTPVPAEEIACPLAYTLGERIELIGYRVPDSPPSPGDPLAVTLYWRALVEMDEDYTVFVHLLDRSETRVGQHDGPPLSNDYPTSYWSPGEVLSDTHSIPLGDRLLPDAYLLVGLYRLADGTRLPAYTAHGDRVPDDAIRLDAYGQ
jgi:4-amino-4-deoxy-L-arabinose transferase-like glycosyltransferase